MRKDRLVLYVLGTMFALSIVSLPIRTRFPFFSILTFALVWIYVFRCTRRFFFSRFSMPLYVFLLGVIIMAWFKIRMPDNWWYIELTRWVMQFTCLAFCIALFCKGDYKGVRNLIVIVMLCWTIYLVITLMSPEGSSRKLAGNAITLEQQIEAHLLKNKGVLDYGCIHALPFLIMGSFCAFKTITDWRRWFFIVMSALMLVTVKHSLFFTALASSFALVLLCLGNVKRIGYRILAISVFSILFMFLWYGGVISSLLKSIQEANADNLIGKKILQIEDYSNGIGDMGGRETKYNMSLDQFYEYPILGNPAFAYLGGHSYLMDVLGGFGLVGFILWSSTFCILSYQMIKVIPKGCKLYYLFALVVFVAMIISKVLAQTLFFAIWFMLPLLLAAREQTYWEAVFRVRRMLGFRNRLRQNVR